MVQTLQTTFSQWLESLAVDQDRDNRSMIAVFHNLKRYDKMFLLQHCYTKHCEVTGQVTVRTKVLSLKSDRLTLKDSLCFLPFEKIHQDLHQSKLTDKNCPTHLKTEIAYLTQIYISSYDPSSNNLQKHRIQQTLKNNPNIIILNPTKVIAWVFLDSCFHILNDKFKLYQSV